MEGFRWMRGARGLGAALVFLGFGAALLAYPAQVQRGLAQSVLYCLASLVPSLFPFMVLASFGVRSGAPGLRRHGAAKLPRGLPGRGPGRLPAAGAGENHPGAGRADAVLLRGPWGGLCGHLCGVGPVGQPAAGLAAFWGGDPLRAAAGPPHRAGQACAPGAPSLPAGGAGRRPHPLGGGRLLRHG